MRLSGLALGDPRAAAPLPLPLPLPRGGLPAYVDSGTTLLLLPPPAWRAFVAHVDGACGHAVLELSGPGLTHRAV